MDKVNELIKKCGEQQVRVILIGTSAGGVDALNKLLTSFKKPSHLSVAVVLHIPTQGKSVLPGLFAPVCEFKTIEPYSQEPLVPETIYFAPSNYHLCLEPNATLSLSSEGMRNFSRPSIDFLFESGAYAFGKRCLAMLLTGANSDGAEGLNKVKRLGGLAIVQDPSEAEYSTMPAAGLCSTPDAYVLTLAQMIILIKGLTGEQSAI